MAYEVVRCRHCGLEVPKTTVGGRATARIWLPGYITKCRRAKDLTALQADCPELRKANAGHN